jgi:hypothetical protein
MMLTTTNHKYSISLLTNDDSKILGNMKPKLKKLQETYNNIQTSKFKTLNSSWTPLNDKNANTSVNFHFIVLVLNLVLNLCHL